MWLSRRLRPEAWARWRRWPSSAPRRGAVSFRTEPRLTRLRPTPVEGARPRPLGLAVGEAERTRAFRRLSLAGVLPTDPVFLALGHIAPYAQDQGLFLHEASAGLTGIGVSSTAGRLVLSPLGDRFGSRASYGAAIAAMAILSFVWLGLPLRMAW